MKKQLIVISGISGAGKSTASIFLEDMGYLCIDQYPVELLEDFIDLVKNDKTNKYNKVAMTISLNELDHFSKLFDNAEMHAEVILVVCSEDEAINRYKFTRRVHPLILSGIASTLSEAIEMEMKLIEKYKTKNCHIIDTTNLSMKQHGKKLEEIASGKKQLQNLAITFESFGFKNGVPDDADIVIDTRILENPFYVEKLRKKTGLDKVVRDYVLNNKKSQEYLDKLVSYLDFTFKAYGNEERRHITVCVGCTGGQHRSVTIADYLYKKYKKEYMCYLTHRELKVDK